MDEDRSQDDPIMTPAEMAAEARISIETWHRAWRHHLPVLRLSARKIGVRRSEWRRAIGEDTSGRDSTSSASP